MAAMAWQDEVPEDILTYVVRTKGTHLFEVGSILFQRNRKQIIMWMIFRLFTPKATPYLKFVNDLDFFFAETEDSLTTEELLDDFTTFFIAGHETTATTMSFLLLEAGRKPEVWKR